MDDIFNRKMARLRDETFQNMNTYGAKIAKGMESLWLKIFGENEDVFLERYETIERHVKELYDDMLKEETDNYNERREALENLIDLSKQLSQELAIDITLPHINIDGTNLRKQLKDVQGSLEEFTKMKEDRLRILGIYKQEEEDVCEKLGEIPQYSLFNSVPSEAKLKEIKSRIVSLNSEKTKRMKSFKSMTVVIQNIVEDLEIANELSYSQKSTLESHDDVILSQEKLQEILEWKKDLIEQKEEQEKLIESLKEKTMLLWNRLDIVGEEREAVIVKTRNRTCGKTVLRVWSDELDRCEHLKLASLKDVILRLRDAITRLWNDCHMDDEERLAFTDFFSDDFNEELLESHEKEEEKLTRFYEQTRELYMLAEKWFQLWNKMVSLEGRSNNAQRLNNRGGQLLKEEKERKGVQKELPKVETKLEKLILKFESLHNKPFLFDGMPLMDLISQYWENRRLEKENEKEVRKTQNQTRVTPMKQNRSVAPSPLSSNRKRLRPVTPLENVAAKKTAKAIPAKRELTMPEKSVKSALPKRRSRSEDPGRRYEEARVLRSNSANSSVVSYSGFQNHLECRNKSTTCGMPPRSSSSPTQPGYGITAKSTNSFKTPTSAVKSATKRTRLNNFGFSKIMRPMIN